MAFLRDFFARIIGAIDLRMTCSGFMLVFNLLLDWSTCV